jgi:hypothetical protein
MKDIKEHFGKENTFIHCPTFEQAQRINDLLILVGSRGFSEKELETYWNVYKDQYVVSTSKHAGYANVEYVQNYNYKLLSASDFLEDTINNSYSIF